MSDNNREPQTKTNPLASAGNSLSLPLSERNIDPPDQSSPKTNPLLGPSQERAKPFAGRLTDISDTRDVTDMMWSSGPTQNTREIRAQMQGLGEQLRNSAGQAITEFAGGLIEGVGYLGELPSVVTQAAGTEREWGNIVSEFGKDVREWGREEAPIYLEEDQREGAGRFLSPSYWAKNGPQIVNALSLMIPATGAAKGVAGLSRLIKGSNLAPKTRALSDTFTAALTSRHMESSMEAAGIFDEKYQEFIDRGMTDQEAREAASAGAASNYRWNYLNMVTDLAGYGALFNAGKITDAALSKGLGDDIFKQLADDGIAQAARQGVQSGSIASRAMGQSGESLLVQVGSEAVEEGSQYVMQKEGNYVANDVAGIGNYDRAKTFAKRVGNYMDDPELWDSAVLGGLGGGVFHVVGEGLDIGNKEELRKESQRQLQQAMASAERTRESVENLQTALNNEDTTEAQLQIGKITSDLVTRSAARGTLGRDIEMLEAVNNMSPEEAESAGLNRDAPTAASRILERAKEVETEYNRYYDNMEELADDPQESDVEKRTLAAHMSMLSNQDNLLSDLEGNLQSSISELKSHKENQGDKVNPLIEMLEERLENLRKKKKENLNQLSDLANDPKAREKWVKDTREQRRKDREQAEKDEKKRVSEENAAQKDNPEAASQTQTQQGSQNAVDALARSMEQEATAESVSEDQGQPTQEDLGLSDAPPGMADEQQTTEEGEAINAEARQETDNPTEDIAREDLVGGVDVDTGIDTNTAEVAAQEKETGAAFDSENNPNNDEQSDEVSGQVSQGLGTANEARRAYNYNQITGGDPYSPTSVSSTTPGSPVTERTVSRPEARRRLSTIESVDVEDALTRTKSGNLSQAEDRVEARKTMREALGLANNSSEKQIRDEIRRLRMFLPEYSMNQTARAENTGIPQPEEPQYTIEDDRYSRRSSTVGNEKLYSTTYNRENQPDVAEFAEQGDKITETDRFTLAVSDDTAQESWFAELDDDVGQFMFNAVTVAQRGREINLRIENTTDLVWDNANGKEQRKAFETPEDLHRALLTLPITANPMRKDGSEILAENGNSINLNLRSPSNENLAADATNIKKFGEMKLTAFNQALAGNQPTVNFVRTGLGVIQNGADRSLGQYAENADFIEGIDFQLGKAYTSTVVKAGGEQIGRIYSDVKPGRTYLIADGRAINRGEDSTVSIPVKTNVRNVNETEARFISALIAYVTAHPNTRDALSHDVSDALEWAANIYEGYTFPNSEGITVNNALDLLIFHGEKSRNNSRPENIVDIGGRFTQIGDYNDGIRLTSNSLPSMGQLEQIQQHLMDHKKRHIDAKSLGQGNDIFDAFLINDSFTFFGEEYSKNSRAKEKLYMESNNLGDPAVVVDIPTVSQPAVAHPVFHFEQDVQYEGKPEEVMEPEPTEETTDESAEEDIGSIEDLADDLTDDDAGDLDDLFSVAPDIPIDQSQQIDIPQEVAHIISLLPENVNVQVVDELIRMHDGENFAQGSFKNAMITISRQAERGTGYHEAFHAVMQLVLDEQQRSDIYSEATDLFVGNYTQRQLEEKLADRFKDYMLSEGNEATAPNGNAIKRFFKRVWTWINELFGSKSRLTIDKLFQNIEQGNYADKSLDMDVRYEGQTLYSEVEDITPFTEEISRADQVSIYSTLSHIALIKQGDVLEGGIKGGLGNLQIDTGNIIKRVRKSILNKAKETSNPAKIKRLRTMMERWTMLQKNEKAVHDGLIDFLKRFGMKDTHEGLAGHTRSAVEFSGKDTATQNIRLLVKLTPKFNSDGSMNKNGYLGMPEFDVYGKTWNKLEAALSGIGSFSEMMNKLSELAKGDPQINYVKSQIDKMDQENDLMLGKTQFFQAFHKINQRHYAVMWDASEFTATVRVMRSAIDQATRDVLDDWLANFQGSALFGGGETLSINKKKAQQIVDRYESFMEEFNANETGNSAQRMSYYDEWASKFIDILHDMGARVSKEALDRGANQHSGHPLDYLGRVANNISYIVTDSDRASIRQMADGEITAKEASFNANILEKSARMRELAEQQAYIDGDFAETVVVGPEGNNYYAFSQYLGAHKQLNDLITNETVRDQFLARPFQGRSMWIPELTEDVKIVTYNNMKEVNNSRDLGVKYQNMEHAREFFMRYNLMLRGLTDSNQKSIMPTMNMSDKSLFRGLEGIEPVANNIELMPTINRLSLNKGSYDRMFNYFMAEVDRILAKMNKREYAAREAFPRRRQDVDLQNSDVVKISFYDENGLDFQIFDFMRYENLEYLEQEQGVDTSDVRKELYNSTDGDIIFPNQARLKDAAKPVFDFFMQQMMLQRMEELQRAGLIKNFNPNNLESFKPNSRTMLFTDELRDYYFDNTEVKPGNLQQVYIKSIGDYVMNSFYANIEQMMMFHGDPAMFKNVSDIAKRTPGPFSYGGYLNMEHPEVKEYFSQITLGDMTKSAPYLEQYRTVMVDVFKERGMSDSQAKKKADELLAAYEKDGSEVSDAQGYVTLDRYREVLLGRGKWTPEHQTVYNKLKRGETDIISDSQLDLMMKPIKGQHYELSPNIEESSLVPVYLKYSQMPLLPGFTEGKPLDNLRRYMEKNDVDEAVYSSGVKVGSTDIQQPFDETGAWNENFDPTSVKLQNKYYKEQVEGATHFFENRNIGTQQRKIQLLNYDPESTYETVAGSLDGDRVREELNALFGSIADQAARELAHDLDVDMGGRVNNVEKLVDMVHEQLVNDQRATEAAINSIQLDSNGNPIAPFSASPVRQLIENVVFAMVRSRITDVGSRGGSFVQATAAGMQQMPIEAWSDMSKEQQEKSIVFNTLKDPSLDADGKFQPGSVLLPSYFKGFFDNPSKMTEEDFRNFFEDNPEMLDAVLYRIPNQTKASIDVVQVAGFLPKEMGDTVVMYEGTTAKTGSDFDFDKMFALIPEVRNTTDGLKMVEYIDGKSEEAIRERYEVYSKNVQGDLMPLEEFRELPVPYQNINPAVHNRTIQMYKSLLDNDSVFVESIASIDGPTTALKNLVSDIRNKLPSSGMRDFQFFQFTELAQMRNKKSFGTGKDMVGIMATHNVSHALAQNSNLAFTNLELPWNPEGLMGKMLDEDNNLISNTISAFLNGSVDVAKDPWIFDLGINGYTAGPAMTLVRTGISRNKLVHFLNHPVVKELYEIQQRSKSPLNKPMKNNDGTYIGSIQALVNKYRNEAYTTERYEDDDGVMKTREVPKEGINEDYLKRLLKGGGLNGNEMDQVFSMEKLNNAVRGGDYGPIEALQVIRAFQDFQGYSSKLVDIQNLMDADTNGPGKSFAELKVKKRAIDNVLDDDSIENVSAIIDDSFLSDFYRNSIDKGSEGHFDMRSLFSTFFFEATPAFWEGVDRLPVSGQDGVKKAFNAMFNMIVSGSPIAKKGKELKSMFYGEDNMAQRLSRIRERDDMDDNILVTRYLKSRPSKGNAPSFVLGNKRAISRQESEFITQSWRELLQHSDEEVRSFGEDLVAYSYHISGMSHGWYTFHDHIPPEFLQDNGYYEYLNDIKRYMVDENYFSDYMMDQLYRHNPEWAEWEYDYTIQEGSKSQPQVVSVNYDRVPPKYIKRERKFQNQYNETESELQLFRHTGREGEADIYERVNILGYDNNSRRIYEYDLKENKGNSIFRTNHSDAPQEAPSSGMSINEIENKTEKKETPSTTEPENTGQDNVDRTELFMDPTDIDTGTTGQDGPQDMPDTGLEFMSNVGKAKQYLLEEGIVDVDFTLDVPFDEAQRFIDQINGKYRKKYGIGPMMKIDDGRVLFNNRAFRAIANQRLDDFVLDLGERYFSEHNRRTSRNVLSDIAMNSPNPRHRMLAERLLEYDIDTDIIFFEERNEQSPDTEEDYQFTREENFGKISGTTNNIFIAPDAWETVILHEIVHLHTLEQIRRLGGRNVQRLQAIFDAVKDDAEINDLYVMNNLEEFVTGIFTDRNLISHLKQRDPVLGTRKEDLTLWQEITRFIADMLGLSSNREISTLDEAMSAGIGIIEDYNRYKNDMNDSINNKICP